MLIGVNWTSPHNYEIITQLAKTGDVDFCEILIDNFLIYEPEVIRDSLPTPQCSFHIMNSHFLQRDLNGLKNYGRRISKAIEILKPIYVSDHIGLFKNNNRYLPFMQEINYNDSFFNNFKERSLIWSDILGSKIYYENFPSFETQPVRQVDFYERILKELANQAHILFDISNALVAEKNGCEIAEEWRNIVKLTPHFHIGGYQVAGNTGYYLDSHNQPISEEAQKLIKILNPLLNKNNSTLVIENDFNLDYNDWHADIKCLKEITSTNV